MKIGDWPFGPSGVDCRRCLRAPCVCAVNSFGPRGELYYWPVVYKVDAAGEVFTVALSPFSGKRRSRSPRRGPSPRGRTASPRR